jgi:hypothetical protein
MENFLTIFTNFLDFIDYLQILDYLKMLNRKYLFPQIGVLNEKIPLILPASFNAHNLGMQCQRTWDPQLGGRNDHPGGG